MQPCQLPHLMHAVLSSQGEDPEEDWHSSTGSGPESVGLLEHRPGVAAAAGEATGLSGPEKSESHC